MQYKTMNYKRKVKLVSIKSFFFFIPSKVYLIVLNMTKKKTFPYNVFYVFVEEEMLYIKVNNNSLVCCHT